MYKELQRKAKKKVEAKMGFYICTVVFSFVTVVLLMLAFYMPAISFWLMLPAPIFVMVLAILYLVAFGVPITGTMSEEWQEEEIEREIIKMYRKKRALLPPPEEMSEPEKLELKELERLRRKWEWEDDYI